MRILILLLLMVVVLKSFAQTINPTFKPLFSSNSANVNVITKQTDGKIILGGDFTALGSNSSPRLARLDLTGTTVDNSFNVGTGPNAFVRAVLPLSTGKILVGGDFTEYNGEKVSSLIRLNSDGTLDETFNIGKGPLSSRVHSLAESTDGKLLIGGVFNKWNDDTSLNGYLVRLNADGTRDSSFNPKINAIGSSAPWVEEIQILSDGKIMIGGYFEVINNTTVNYFCRLNADGTIDTSFSNTGINGLVATFSQQSTGQWIIGGNFTLPATGIARLSTNGTYDATFNSPFSSSISVSKIVIDASNNIIVGGRFFSPKNSILRLSPTGALDNGFNVGTGVSGGFNSVSDILLSSTNILISGFFEYYNGIPRISYASLNTTGAIQSMDLKIGGRGDIRAVYVQPSGKVVIGGFFDKVNGISHGRLVRLNADGTIDNTFTTNIGTGGDYYVSSIAAQSDGKLIIAGEFNNFNAVSSWKIVRLSQDGVRDNSFGNSPGFNGTVNKVYVLPDNTIIAGGSFATYNGVSRKSILKLNSNGTLDNTFNSTDAFTESVIDFDIKSSGKIAAVFNGYYNSTSAGWIRLLNANGTLDTNYPVYNSYDGSNRIPSSVVFQADGKIVAGLNSSNSQIIRFLPNGLRDDYTLQLPSVNNTIAYPVRLSILNNKLFVGYAPFYSSDGDINENYLKVFDVNGNQSPLPFKLVGSVNALAASANALYMGGIVKRVDQSAYFSLVKADLPITLNSPSALAVNTPEKGKVQLNWIDNSTGELGFEILRSNPNNTDYKTVSYVSANSNSYTDLTAEPEKIVYYKVRAYSLNTVSSESNEVSITPLPNVPFAASKISLTESEPTKIKITWQDNSENETEFQVYRNAVLIKSLPPNTVEFTNIHLESGSTHTYYIKTINSLGSTNSISASLTLSDPTIGSWSDKNTTSLGRYSAIAFTINGKAYMGTGSNAGGRLKDLWEYDPTADSWTQKADFPGIARLGAVAFAIGGKGYVGLGNDGSGSFKRDFYQYDPVANTWIQMADFPQDETSGAGLSSASSFTIDEFGYVGLGNNGTNNPKTFWRYDPANNKWERKADFPGAGRSGGVGFAVAGKGYMGLGGVSTLYSDIYLYTPSTNTWSTSPHYLPSSGRAGATAFVTNGRAYIGLGDIGTFPNPSVVVKDMYELKASPAAWKTLPYFTGTERSSAVSFVIGTTAYVGMGVKGSTYFTDLKAFTPGTILLPTIPTNFTLTLQTTSEIKLTWTDNADNELEYLVEGYSTNESQYKEIAVLPANSTSFNHTGLISGYSYWYRIRAINYNGNSDYASAQTSLVFAPTAPSQLKLTQSGNNLVKIEWVDNSSNETSFDILRSSDNITYAKTGAVSQNVLSYSDFGLAPSSKYYYKVKAINSAGGSESDAISIQLKTIPIAPGNAPSNAPIIIGFTSVELSWKDNSDNEEGFRIYRAPGTTSTFLLIGTTDADVVKFKDETVSANTPYSYQIRAFNSAGESGSVSYVLRTNLNPGTTLEAPSQLTVKLLSETSVQITWTINSTTQNGFQLQRATGSGDYMILNSSAEKSFTDSNLAKNQIYKYKVRAYNNVAFSDFSNEASIDLSIVTGIEDFTTTLKVYPNPFEQNFSITSANESITASLADVTGRTLETHHLEANTTQKIGTDLTSGVYLLKVSTGSRKGVIKLIKR